LSGSEIYSAGRRLAGCDRDAIHAGPIANRFAMTTVPSATATIAQVSTTVTCDEQAERQP